MANAMNTVGNSREDGKSPCGPDLKHKVESAFATGMDKAEDLVSSVVDKAKDAASSVAHTVGEAGSTVGNKANEATAAVGGGMKSLAGAIRENTPHEGVFGTASASVANRMESGGRYLQEEGLGGMAEDVTNMIRRNPIPAVLVGIGVGFLLAKLTTTRS